jgi:hypothetical protein
MKAAPTLEKARARSKNMRANVEGRIEQRIESDAENGVEIHAPGASTSVTINPDTTATDTIPSDAGDTPKKEEESEHQEREDESESPDAAAHFKLDLSL